MLSETLSQGLANYRIGPKIRALRTGKSLGLTQLGSHTGLSAGMLSKIETGQVVPTLPTLMRIALVFGVGLEHFFEESEAPLLEVIRAKTRIRLPNTTETMPSFFFESLDFPVNDRPVDAYLAEFLPRTSRTDPHDIQASNWFMSFPERSRSRSTTRPTNWAHGIQCTLSLSTRIPTNAAARTRQPPSWLLQRGKGNASLSGVHLRGLGA